MGGGGGGENVSGASTSTGWLKNISLLHFFGENLF